MSLVSVIIPFYNPGKGLLRTLKSILCQSHTNIEIICVNDGSTDDSIDVFRDITDDRVRLIPNNRTKGQSGASNCGLQIAKGQYVKFVDADDVLNQRHIELCLNALSQFATGLQYSIGLVSHTLENARGELVEKHLVDKPSLHACPEAFRSLMLNHEMLAAWKWFIPMGLFRQHGLTWDETLTRNKDFVFSSSLLAKAQSVVTVRDAIYHYTITPGSEGKTVSENALQSIIRAHFLGVNAWGSTDLEAEFDFRLRKIQQYIYSYDNVLANSLDDSIRRNQRFVLLDPNGHRWLARIIGWRGVKRLGRFKRKLFSSPSISHTTTGES